MPSALLDPALKQHQQTVSVLEHCLIYFQLPQNPFLNPSICISWEMHSVQDKGKCYMWNKTTLGCDRSLNLQA